MERRCFLAEWSHWTHGHFQRSVPQKLSWPLGLRIEVGLLADKYQVDELQKAASWMGDDGRRG